jgi:hypothetical protein
LKFTTGSGNECTIEVENSHVTDFESSYGIGAAGIGDGAGYVKLSCSLPATGDLCNKPLSASNITYVPFGEWNADYNGSQTISGVLPDTLVTVKVIATDNAGRIREDVTTTTGCTAGT